MAYYFVHSRNIFGHLSEFMRPLASQHVILYFSILFSEVCNRPDIYFGFIIRAVLLSESYHISKNKKLSCFFLRLGLLLYKIKIITTSCRQMKQFWEKYIAGHDRISNYHWIIIVYTFLTWWSRENIYYSGLQVLSPSFVSKRQRKWHHFLCVTQLIPLVPWL